MDYMVQDGKLWFNMCVEGMYAYSKHGLSDSKKPYTVLLKIYPIILKTCYASSHISIDSKFFKNLWNKMHVWTFHEKLIKTWKGQFGSNHIVCDTVFLRAFKMQELYVRYMKIDKIYLRGQYWSIHIAHPCKDNKSQAVLSLDQNVLDMPENATLCDLFVLLIVGKYNMWIICAFDKNWSNFPNWTISVNLYCQG